MLFIEIGKRLLAISSKASIFAKDNKTEQEQIKQNRLLYYYYAKEWKKFAQKQKKYFSTKNQTPKDWRNWELLSLKLN